MYTVYVYKNMESEAVQMFQLDIALNAAVQHLLASTINKGRFTALHHSIQLSFNHKRSTGEEMVQVLHYYR